MLNIVIPPSAPVTKEEREKWLKKAEYGGKTRRLIDHLNLAEAERDAFKALLQKDYANFCAKNIGKPICEGAKSLIVKDDFCADITEQIDFCKRCFIEGGAGRIGQKGIDLLRDTVKGEYQAIQHFTAWAWGGVTHLMTPDGSGYVKITDMDNDQSGAIISELSVREDARRKGLASFLIAFCEGLVRSRGKTEVALWADKCSWMQAWYERIGYTVGIEKEGDPGQRWMEKRLE